jgi:hypothetical protein
MADWIQLEGIDEVKEKVQCNDTADHTDGITGIDRIRTARVDKW